MFGPGPRVLAAARSWWDLRPTEKCQPNKPQTLLLGDPGALGQPRTLTARPSWELRLFRPAPTALSYASLQQKGDEEEIGRGTTDDASTCIDQLKSNCTEAPWHLESVVLGSPRTFPVRHQRFDWYEVRRIRIGAQMLFTLGKADSATTDDG